MIGLGLMLNWPSESQDSVLSISRWITEEAPLLLHGLSTTLTVFCHLLTLIIHEKTFEISVSSMLILPVHN